MKTWKKYCAGLAALAGLTPGLWAQPAAPAVPAAPAAPAPANLFSFLCPTAPQIKECKEKICKSPLGQLMNNALKPVSIFTGGILGNCCPSNLPPPPGASPAEGAAGAIQAEEANAKARRAAAHYLGTVDCHYYPEAGEQLAILLRQDRNECVRWEAAMSLGRGCCCNALTVKALSITVSGSKSDGHPFEKSERVKAAAAASLEHCLGCLGVVPGPEKKEETPIPPELQKKKKKPEDQTERLVPHSSSEVTQATLAEQVKRVPFEQIVEEARKILGDYQHERQVAAAQGTHNHSLTELLSYAFSAPSLLDPLFNDEEKKPAVVVSAAAEGSKSEAVVPAASAEPPLHGVATAIHETPAAPPTVLPPLPPSPMPASSTSPAPVPAPVPPPSSTYRPVSPAPVKAPAPSSTVVPPAPAPTSTYLPSRPQAEPPPAKTPSPASSYAPVGQPSAKTPTWSPIPVPPPSPLVPAPASGSTTTPTPAPTPSPKVAPAAPAVPSTSSTPMSAVPSPMPATAQLPPPAPLVTPSPKAPAAVPAVPTTTSASIVPAVSTTTYPAAVPTPPARPAVPPPPPVVPVPPVLPTPGPVSRNVTPPVQVASVSPKPALVQPASVPETRIAAPAAAAPAAAALSPTLIHQLLTVLRESAYPEQREWAAERLAVVNPQHYPQVMQTILRTAREDMTPMVQVACIRSLVQMNSCTPEVAAALEALRSASDPRVRFEAGQALARVGATSGRPAGTTMLPAAYNNTSTR